MRVVSVVTLLLALVVATPPGGHSEGTAGQAEIRIREVRAPGSPIPIEGEISYVRVSARDGATVRRTRIPFGGAWVRIPVRRGSYAVAVWHRTCDANCNYLDPPTDRCRSTVVVRAGASVRVMVRNAPGSPCRIVRST
jgi:hypothetical protein